MDINNVVEIGRHLVETLLGGEPQGIGNFDVATGIYDLHRRLL
jgi:hypothetical protein